jgi:hypothetical protein
MRTLRSLSRIWHTDKRRHTPISGDTDAPRCRTVHQSLDSRTTTLAAGDCSARLLGSRVGWRLFQPPDRVTVGIKLLKLGIPLPLGDEAPAILPGLDRLVTRIRYPIWIAQPPGVLTACFTVRQPRIDVSYTQLSE